MKSTEGLNSVGVAIHSLYPKKDTEGLNPVGTAIIAIGLLSAILFVSLFLYIFVVSCQKSEKWHDEQIALHWDKIVSSNGQMDVAADRERIRLHNPYDILPDTMICLLLGGIIGLYIISPKFRMLIHFLILFNTVMRVTSAVKKHYDL
jgi:hypothetical protein